MILAFNFSFAQEKKESIDTIHISGSFYSIEQKKVITYQVAVEKSVLRNMAKCYGYLFTDKEGNMIAYTPCGDYSLGRLVVLDKDKFIEFLKANMLSFK